MDVRRPYGALLQWGYALSMQCPTAAIEQIVRVETIDRHRNAVQAPGHLCLRPIHKVVDDLWITPQRPWITPLPLPLH